jgi:hypothetical protein
MWSQEGRCTITVEGGMLNNMSNSMVRIQYLLYRYVAKYWFLSCPPLISGPQIPQELQCATPGCKKQKHPNPKGGHFDYCSLYCRENGLTSGMCLWHCNSVGPPCICIQCSFHSQSSNSRLWNMQPARMHPPQVPWPCQLEDSWLLWKNSRFPSEGARCVQYVWLWFTNNVCRLWKSVWYFPRESPHYV